MYEYVYGSEKVVTLGQSPPVCTMLAKRGPSLTLPVRGNAHGEGTQLRSFCPFGLSTCSGDIDRTRTPVDHTEQRVAGLHLTTEIAHRGERGTLAGIEIDREQLATRHGRTWVRVERDSHAVTEIADQRRYA